MEHRVPVMGVLGVQRRPWEGKGGCRQEEVVEVQEAGRGRMVEVEPAGGRSVLEGRRDAGAVGNALKGREPEIWIGRRKMTKNMR